MKMRHDICGIAMLLSGALYVAGCEKGGEADAPLRDISFSVSVPADGTLVKTIQRRSDNLFVPETVLSAFGTGGGLQADSLYLLCGTVQGIAADTAKTVTKGAPAISISDFGLFAYSFSGAWNESSVRPDYIYNERVAASSGWSTSKNYPGGSGKIRFYAYSPYGCEGLSLPSGNASGTPKMSYTVPSAVASQRDLLYAVSSDISCSAAPDRVPMRFVHALTAVRFVVGQDVPAGTVKSVSLKGVLSSGVCTMASSPVWSSVSYARDFTVAPGKTVSGTAGESITPEAQTFMMIPQTLPSGASIEILFNDGTDHLLRASIAGTLWQAGTTVTYRINTSSISGTPVFTITPASGVPYIGGTSQFTVTSCRRRSDGSSTPLPWSIYAYSTDGGASWSASAPSWMSLSGGVSGSGSAAGESRTVTVAAQTAVSADIASSHDDALRNAAPVSGYDLSTNGGTTAMNTANCYIVNAPGTYTFPLVYGNAIVGGVANENAYKSFVGGGGVSATNMSGFLNHLGNAISSPFIYQNSNCSENQIKDAVLLWQDSQELVAGVALSADKHSVSFSVPQGTIRQGNALVAVRDNSNRIMWSWHIWVTDYHLGDYLTPIIDNDISRSIYKIMPRALGWVYTGDISTVYSARSVWLAVTQPSTGAVGIVAVDQYGFSQSTLPAGYAMNYQWGRKDPLPPYGLSVYYNDGTYKPGLKNQTVEYNVSIQNPTVRYGTYNSAAPQNWCKTPYGNLWLSHRYSSSSDYVKTVYDPCPAGFRVHRTSNFFITDNRRFEQLGSQKEPREVTRLYCLEGVRVFVESYTWTSQMTDSGRLNSMYFWSSSHNGGSGTGKNLADYDDFGNRNSAINDLDVTAALKIQPVVESSPD